MMNVLSWISGILKPAKDLTEVFVENREGRAKRKHEETLADSDLNAAVLNQFAQEFAARERRTWWDSVVDGLNRLPRPLIALSLVGFFAAAPFFPERIIQVSRAYEVIPPGFWALLSIVIGFYFGGRMQLKAQDFRMKGRALEAARELTQIREEFRSFVMAEEPPEETTYQRAVANSDGRP
ncbi:hypothetical protein H0Z60_14510, partial [Ectothiorhodospiraceae bacterium WFHF3C12]|nr:hypothetical protein [Ectothiorhodospiraceae bacterium WFHF3C12]